MNNDKPKHAGGRPSEYKDSFVQDVETYIATTGREQTKLATMQGLALHLKVNGDTLVEWAGKYPEFSAAIDKLKATQAEQLINDGIYGGKEINATIVKLMLMNNHGMREKSDVTTDDEPIQPIDVGSLLAKVYGSTTDSSSDQVPSDG